MSLVAPHRTVAAIASLRMCTVNAGLADRRPDRTLAEPTAGPPNAGPGRTPVRPNAGQAERRPDRTPVRPNAGPPARPNEAKEKPALRGERAFVIPFRRTFVQATLRCAAGNGRTNFSPRRRSSQAITKTSKICMSSREAVSLSGCHCTPIPNQSSLIVS
jgi:hypothetical protein